MKKTGIMCLFILLCVGCGTSLERETKVLTCRQDTRYDIYSLTNENVIYSKDEKTVSSIRTSSVYNASFDDTDFSYVTATFDALKEEYDNNYQGVTVERIDHGSELVYNIQMPLNEVNKAKLKSINQDIFEGEDISISKYQAMLESEKYHCSK